MALNQQNIHKKTLQDCSIQQLIDIQILNYLEKISNQIALLESKLAIKNDINGVCV